MAPRKDLTGRIFGKLTVVAFGGQREWVAIQTRCYNEKEKTWPYYGGRGIKVCARWRGETGFKNFIKDMGPRPSAQHLIERYYSVRSRIIRGHEPFERLRG